MPRHHAGMVTETPPGQRVRVATPTYSKSIKLGIQIDSASNRLVTRR